MLLKVKGIVHNIDGPIVGRVTRDFDNQDREIFIADTNNVCQFTDRYKAILMTITMEGNCNTACVSNLSSTDHLRDGDIIVINSDGVINTLYRVDSTHNSILVTERCNSNCLMCSQPPKDRNDIDYLFQIHKLMIPLIPKDCREIGITGGEPLLLGEHFFELIGLINKYLPDTEIHCLTNGRIFAWKKIVGRLSTLKLDKVVFGIPLYSDDYQTHDYIVQAKNAFEQTMIGLYNLAEYDVRIEIRIVLHKQTVPRLQKLAHYIYKNLPFVEHVAFMGLEHIGYTPYNFNKLFIDSDDLVDDLLEAIDYLSIHGMNVSIYNMQLCTIPSTLWQFSRQSISDWKNRYLDVCDMCTVKDDCCGFFEWNMKNVQNNIKPIF